MERKETTDTEIPNLNHDCLEHVFQFVAPKDWPAFVRVCKSWKLAANNRFLKLSFFFIDSVSNKRERESMSFAEFKNILEFIAPQLRYANIQVSEFWSGDALIRFGHFEYQIKGPIDASERNELMNILATRSKNIKTLKIETFDGATNGEWENFFRVNEVITFKFMLRSFNDRSSLFQTYIPMLPNNLERVCITNEHLLTKTLNNNQLIAEEAELLQFLDRLPRIRKLKLVDIFIPPLRLARILSKHVDCITDLSLNDCFNRLEGSTILSVIPNCTNLTHLMMQFDMTLNDDLCTRIADNCHSIRRLSLFPRDELLGQYPVKEKQLTTLLSLPNLEDLRTFATKIVLTTKAKKLKKLFFRTPLALVIPPNFVVDFNNFSDALAFMPCLSSLTLNDPNGQMTKSAALSIKQTILSRGQNIVLYTNDSVDDPFKSVDKVDCEFIKKWVIRCNTKVLNGEFAFFCLDGGLHEVAKLVYV